MKQQPIHNRLLGCLLLAFTCAASPHAWAAPAEAAAPQSVRDVAEKALWWGDFAELERENAEFRQPGHFDSDGGSQLEEFRFGLGMVFDAKEDNAEPYLRELEALTLQWATEHPKSALAHTLYANALLSHAWSYRGRGYVKDVPPEAWRDFRAYLVRAFDYLKAHSDVAFTDSYAHYTLIKIGRGLELDAQQLNAIAQDGLKRNPEDISIYFELMTGMLPKWGGDARQLDRYIRETAEQTKAQHGMGMYARLYSAAADEQFGHELFANSQAKWPLMKQGFEDLLARYPNSPMRRNRFAYMACLARDKATLRSLLDGLGQNLDAAQWGPNGERSLESCRNWAKQQGSVGGNSWREGV